MSDHPERVTLSGNPPEPGFEDRAGAPAPIDPATGMHKDYWILSQAERAKGFVRPVRQKYIHSRCGVVTVMGLALAETYARDPSFYGATFCVGCGGHYPVGEHGEFTWDGTNEKVGTQMPPLVYGIPFIAFKTAATSRIKLVGNGIYGSGTISGSLATPASKKLQSLYDVRAAASPIFPYFVWGAHTASPEGAENAVFGQAAIASSITGHIFSDRQYSTDEVDEICDRLCRLFHHQDLTLSGYTTQKVSFDVVDVVPDPVGQHGIVMFRPLNRVTPV